MNNIFKTTTSFGIELYYHDFTEQSDYDDIIEWLSNIGCEFLPEERDLNIGTTIFIADGSTDCLMMLTKDFNEFKN